MESNSKALVSLAVSLIRAGKTDTANKAEFLRQTDAMDAGQLDAYAKALRAAIKDATGTEEAKAAALQRVSTYATIQRKAKGFAAKRAKGAGRKATPEKAEPIPADMSPVDRLKLLAAAYVEAASKVGKSERETVHKAMLGAYKAIA